MKTENRKVASVLVAMIFCLSVLQTGAFANEEVVVESTAEEVAIEEVVSQPEPVPVVEEYVPEPEPAPVVEEYVPEPEPAPVVEEYVPEPEPAPVVEEYVPEPEPDPVVEEYVPEPEPDPLPSSEDNAVLSVQSVEENASKPEVAADANSIQDETQHSAEDVDIERPVSEIAAILHDEADPVDERSAEEIAEECDDADVDSIESSPEEYLTQESPDEGSADAVSDADEVDAGLLEGLEEEVNKTLLEGLIFNPEVASKVKAEPVENNAPTKESFISLASNEMDVEAVQEPKELTDPTLEASGEMVAEETEEPELDLSGDVDHDGAVTMADAHIVITYALHKGCGGDMSVADVTNDNCVSLADGVAIAQKAAGCS